MIWSDDPVRDAAMYDIEADNRLKQLPVCDECGEHIQDEYYYEFRDWVICPSCMEEHRRWNSDY